MGVAAACCVGGGTSPTVTGVPAAAGKVGAVGGVGGTCACIACTGPPDRPGPPGDMGAPVGAPVPKPGGAVTAGLFGAPKPAGIPVICADGMLPIDGAPICGGAPNPGPPPLVFGPAGPLVPATGGVLALVVRPCVGPEAGGPPGGPPTPVTGGVLALSGEALRWARSRWPRGGWSPGGSTQYWLRVVFWRWW